MTSSATKLEIHLQQQSEKTYLYKKLTWTVSDSIHAGNLDLGIF